MPSGGHSDMMSNIILFLLSLVMFFGTGCSHTVETQDSVPAENDLVIQEESVNNSVETGEETVRKGQTEILTQVEGIDTDQADRCGPDGRIRRKQNSRWMPGFSEEERS